MAGVITLAIGMILLPCCYGVILKLCQPSFQKEENQKRRIFRSIPELLTLLGAEAALVRIWWALGKPDVPGMTFLLLYVMLAAMTALCIMDYWEHVVPNRILGILLLIFVIIIGLQGLRDMEVVLAFLPGMLLGLLFCMISFGLGYLLSHRNMGAGDVKLALVMGIFLGGEYVVGAVLYGCIISAIFSIVQLLRKKLSRKDTIPFVPFLYIGLIIRYLLG